MNARTLIGPRLPLGFRLRHGQNGMPGRYAVFGNPIGHSQSPLIHTLFAAQVGIQLDYQPLLAPLECFGEAVKRFRDADGCGANVTLPFKHQAFVLAHFCSKRAKQACAANTLCFSEEGLIYADNTDGEGLLCDLLDNLHLSLNGARLLLLGAGGAASGVLGALLEAGPAEVHIVNRTPAKAVELASHFAVLGCVKGSGLEDIGNKPYDLIINATSASLDGEVPALPPSILHADSWCYDMAYGGRPTAFLNWAQAQGATRLSDGLGMLVEQAAAAFQIWHGVRPMTAPVIAAVRRALHEASETD